MQADSEDRYTDDQPRAGLPKLPIALVVLAILIGVIWYFTGEKAPEPAAPPAAVTPAAPPAPVPAEPAPAPDIPAEEPAPQVAAEPNEPPPAPLTLEDSDPVVREVVTPALQAPVYEQALRQQDLLERSTALIDAAAGGSILRKVLPLPPIEGKFSVNEVAGKAVVDPASYQRYDAYAEAIDDLDPEQLAAAFHRFRPLLEQSYSALGYKPDDLDNALIRALDRVIAAPVLDEPPVVEKDVTTYKYADPNLEQQSSMAKQLMRMGPENERKVQAKAKALRAALLGK